MRNKIIILFFIFISSCQNLPIFEKVQNYEKVGFAEISKGDQIIHHTIVPSSQIRITNLLNNKNIEFFHVISMKKRNIICNRLTQSV